VEKAAAVGEQIYRLAKTMKVKINKDIALCLYTSILTDTGSFRYTNTTAETFAIASELIQHGIEPSKIARAIYENRTPSALKILGFCLNNAKLSKDNKVVWTEITQENLRDLGAKDEEVSGIVDYLRTIKNIEVTLIFHETKTGKIKVNFRSKDKINVCEIAKKFGGGGHYKAAGCQIEGPLDKTKTLVLEEVKKALA
jgi:phosphoesterase RecJ-like protein